MSHPPWTISQPPTPLPHNPPQRYLSPHRRWTRSFLSRQTISGKYLYTGQVISGNFFLLKICKLVWNKLNTISISEKKIEMFKIIKDLLFI